MLIVAGLGLLAGNFLIYPQQIAQAWDATPAHIPYYEQTEAAIDFLQQQNIPLTSVGSVFPSVGPRDWRDLDGEQAGFKSAELGIDRYIYLSLIHNDWSDEDLDFIDSNYEIRWQQNALNGVWSAVYQLKQ